MTDERRHRTDAEEANPWVRSDDDLADTERAFWIDFGARLIIVLAVYVLSIGPMYWTWYGARFLNGSRFIQRLYEPLYQVAWLIPPFGRWLNWYICLWIY